MSQIKILGAIAFLFITFSCQQMPTETTSVTDYDTPMGLEDPESLGNVSELVATKQMSDQSSEMSVNEVAIANLDDSLGGRKNGLLAITIKKEEVQTLPDGTILTATVSMDDANTKTKADDWVIVVKNFALPSGKTKITTINRPRKPIVNHPNWTSNNLLVAEEGTFTTEIEGFRLVNGTHQITWQKDENNNVSLYTSLKIRQRIRGNGTVIRIVDKVYIDHNGDQANYKLKYQVSSNGEEILMHSLFKNYYTDSDGVTWTQWSREDGSAFYSRQEGNLRIHAFVNSSFIIQRIRYATLIPEFSKKEIKVDTYDESGTTVVSTREFTLTQEFDANSFTMTKELPNGNTTQITIQETPDGYMIEKSGVEYEVVFAGKGMYLIDPNGVSAYIFYYDQGGWEVHYQNN